MALFSRKGRSFVRQPKGVISKRWRSWVVEWRNAVLTLTYEGRYSAVRITRFLAVVGRRAVCLRGGEGGQMMPREPNAPASAGMQPPRSKSGTFGVFEELTSWLADRAYPSGKAVGMVALTIRPKGREYLVQLRIQDQGGMVITTQDESLDDALMALECSLAADPVPWVKDDYPLGVSQQKKK
jgi:hypothetical protein